MKALVLAGGFPQIELIKKLQNRGYYTILADYYEKPVARDYADEFYQISTLDVSAIKQLAIDEDVDFLITVCTDQALLTVAKVSEELGLPCYIDYRTALDVTNKSYMKNVFMSNCIPTAKYMIFDNLNSAMNEKWKYPVIVKPVDCNSSKGVKKVDNEEKLKMYLNDALSFSRTKTALIEEFINGEELSVDVYVENGIVHILDITKSEKIKDEDKFVIFRSWHPANITSKIKKKVTDVAKKIADAFKLKDSPMLIQIITDGNEIYVIEFSARTGGGVKFKSILRQTGIDIIDAVIDLTVGKKPIIMHSQQKNRYVLDEYIYCYPGIYDHLEGFSDLKESGKIVDYYIFSSKGTIFDAVEKSGDRLAGFTIVADTMEELNQKHCFVNERIRAISTDGKDIIRHDLLPAFY